MNNIGKISKGKGVIVFLLSLFILLCYYPYEFYSVYFLFLPDEFLYSQALFLVILFLLYLSSSFKKPLPGKLLFIFLVQYLGFAMYSIHHGHNLNSYIASFVQMALPVLLILWIDSTMGILEFFRKYNRWILWMAILGAFTWVLVVFFHYSPLYGLPDRADGRIIYNYLFTFTKTEMTDVSNSFCYSGFFDERGAMGYWGMFALIFNKLFIKDKRLEYILMGCLLLTFSMGFYFQVIIYIALFYFAQQKTSRKLLMAVCLIIIVVGASMTKGTKYNFVYDNSVGRIVESFTYAKSEQTIAVSTRATLTKAAYEEWQRNPWFGTDSADDMVQYTDNIYEPLVYYGIIGIPFVLFPFIWLLFYGFKNNRDLFKCMIVIFAGFFHRPFHQSLLYGFILYSLIYIMLVYKNRIQMTHYENA